MDTEAGNWKEEDAGVQNDDVTSTAVETNFSLFSNDEVTTRVAIFSATTTATTPGKCPT